MARLPISAAMLLQRVTLQQRTVGVDSLGQDLTTWADVAQVWALVEPLRGREYFAAGQAQAPVDVRITIRWRAGLLPAMRVVYGAVAYDIAAVIDVENAHHTIELMCTTGVRDGRAV